MNRSGSLVFVALMSVSGVSQALPMYAQRSGRTCGNCHVSPTLQDPDGWENPKLADRKCNMSCMACHVNPGGGAIRNTSGRYYAGSTLGIFPFHERSYSDYGRELFGQNEIRAVRRLIGRQIPTADGPKTIPSNYEEALAEIGGNPTGGLLQFGNPAFGPSKHAFWDGRYGELNADPLLSFGGDFRVAYWTGNQKFFPMQLDLHVALHPVEHVTIMATAAGRGRASGFDTLGETESSDQFPIFARNAFLMIHELPFMFYGKGGLFLPQFGQYIDDHTSFTREYFELQVSTSDDVVLGGEVGLAPNYPYANIAFFRNGEGIDRNPELDGQSFDPGWGGTFNAGYRDLGWSLGVQGMIRRRDVAVAGQQVQGDMTVGGILWGFNPFYYSNKIPITYIGELDIGSVFNPEVDRETATLAMMHELWITIVNGIFFRSKYDLGTRDLEFAGALEQRFSAGVEVVPIPGVSILPLGRVLWANDERVSGDFFLQMRLYF